MTTTVDPVRVEHHDVPVGIGEASPRLSWVVRTDVPGWVQAGYEVEVLDADGAVRAGSGAVGSSASVLVPWPSDPLASRERVTVRVRVRGGGPGVTPDLSGWSEPTVVEAGLLSPSDWTAGAVAPHPRLTGGADGPVDGPAPLLRRTFTVDGEVASARLYLTAHGITEVELNGRLVGDDVLAPGWTSYGHRLRYRTHDVTDLLRDGENALGAMLADGWYRGRLGFRGGRSRIYGDRTALIAQLEITYADGRSQVVATDAGWRSAAGPITATGLYDGETHDARLEVPGWSAPGFDDSAWLPVDVLDHDPALLVAPTGPPVRRTGVLAPVSVSTAPGGGLLVDFGQNLAGRLRIRVSGPAGHTVELRHAEVLEDGDLSLRPLRGAPAVDRYTLKGDGVEVWEPRFTQHGFRYARLDNWPGALGDGDVEAVVLHSDLRRTGTFECSDADLNRLHENVVWSMRGNVVDLPTDCPQRDERLGWTGDFQVFAPTASFLYDCNGFARSWLADLAAEQAEHGTVPPYVPHVELIFPPLPAAAWGDAAVVVPWVLYQRFGDLGVLRDQYPSMKAWVDQIDTLARPDHLWDEGFQFGDWLDPAAPPDKPADARTDKYLVATAYHAYTAQLLADTAALLGKDDDHRRYAALAADVRAAFTDEYVTPNGRLTSDAQTGYALAIAFDLLPKAEQRGRAGRRLAELVATAGHTIATGFVGTPIVADALSSTGHHETAYHLLTQRQCPSWLYPVTMGATTIWERWDSLLPDGSVNPGEMTSFNHYALGAVADWMHRSIAGLAPAAPGYRRLRVAPVPGGGLRHAAARLETPYGTAEVAWRREGGRLDLTVTVPANTTAEVLLPQAGATATEVGAGTHTFSCPFPAAENDPPMPVPFSWAPPPEDDR